MLVWLLPFSGPAWVLLLITPPACLAALWLVTRLTSSDLLCSPRSCPAIFLTTAWAIFALAVTAAFFQQLQLGGAAGPGRQQSFTAALGKLDRLLAVDGGSTLGPLRGSQAPLHTTVWHRLQQDLNSSLVENYAEGLERVRAGPGQAGLLMEAAAAEFLGAEDCSLYSLGRLADRHYAFGFRRSVSLSCILHRND